MKISIVIATFNRHRFLRQTLASVFAQQLPAEDYEVVVVDDGSTDGTADWLRRLRPPCRFQLLEQPNRGQTVALNAGVRAATGDWVLFLDDDLLCEPTLLQEHLASHADANRSVVLGPMVVSPDSTKGLAGQWMRLLLDEYYARLAEAGRPLWPENAYVGPNCSLPRSLLVEAGGYDEALLPCRLEDIELGLRLWKQGVKFCYRPQARAYHLHAKSAREIAFAEAPQDGRSFLRLGRKHPDYRPHSPLALLTAGPGWKRWGRQLALRLSFPLGLLAPLLWLAEEFSAVTPVRSLGVRLLGGLRAYSLWRGAVREAGSWKELKAEYGVELPALLYHRVAPDHRGPHPELTLSPQRFQEQIAWLARRGYTGIRPSDWLAWREQGKPLPEKPVLLTFDDAYAELAEHAFPVLCRYGFGGGVYVVTRYLGETNRWDAAGGIGPFPLLTADQIRQWAGRGIEFGAHSRTHPNLAALEPSQIEQEVAGSADDLAALLGARPACFAYPYGEFNRAALAAARAHYPLAFSCEEGVNTLATDPLQLRRTMVLPADSMLEFACRVRWGFNPVWNARLWLRPRTRLRNALAGLRARFGRGESG